LLLGPILGALSKQKSAAAPTGALALPVLPDFILGLPLPTHSIYSKMEYVNILFWNISHMRFLHPRACPQARFLVKYQL